MTRRVIETVIPAVDTLLELVPHDVLELGEVVETYEPTFDDLATFILVPLDQGVLSGGALVVAADGEDELRDLVPQETHPPTFIPDLVPIVNQG
jgi:hypothetical protein